MGIRPEVRLGKADSMSGGRLDRSPEEQLRPTVRSYLLTAWIARMTRIDRTCSADPRPPCHTPFQNLRESRFCFRFRKARSLGPTTHSANRQTRLSARNSYSPSCKTLACRLPVPPDPL